MSEQQELRAKLVSQEAAYWYIRFCSQDLSERCKSEFIAWARSSPEHIAEMLRICEMDGAARRGLQRFNLHDPIGIKDQLQAPRADEFYISLSYLQWVRRQYLIAQVALVAVAIAAFAAWLVQHDLFLLGTASAAFVTFLLLFCKEQVMKCRISNGFFGAAESEVRDLIEFIFSNADKVDFTDGHGTPRKCWVPEPSSPSVQVRAVRAGVLSR